MMNKTMKRVGASLMAVMMIGIMAMPAMAAPPSLNDVTGGGATGNPNGVLTDTIGSSVSAANLITKNYIFSMDVETPAETFSFTATPIQLTATTNNDTGNTTAAANGLTAPTTDCPAITISDVTIALSETGTRGNVTTDASDNINGFTASTTGASQLIQKKTSFLSNAGVGGTTALEGIDFPHAGEYVYTVKETVSATAAANNNFENGVYYSGAEYEVHFFVANTNADDVANGLDALYIAAINAVRRTNNDGYNAVANAANASTKVNLNNNSGYNNTGNQLSFQNIYVKQSKLTISKKVSGAYADQTKYFDYTIKLTVPKDVAAYKTLTVTGYVYETADNGTTWTKVATTADNNGNPVSISMTMSNYTATDSNMLLKHNQKIVFETSTGEPNLPIGTVYGITEGAAVDYLAKASIVYNNALVATDSLSNTSSTMNTAFSLKTYDPANASSTDHTVVGDGGTDYNNEAKFFNTYKTVTPTGIVINNLPYILMILVAFGAAFMYLVAKRRKNNQ